MSRIEKHIGPRLHGILVGVIQPPWILLMACILAYGIMIPWLGLYSDDWILLSTFQKMGSAGLTRYFATNRPVWGWIYQVTLPLLGKTPWHWHLFGLFWHWTASVSLWWLVSLVWPRQKNLALWAALLFAVYPGFNLQPISMSFGHIFIVYTAFLLSACFLILACRNPKKAWFYTTMAIATSLVNLLCMEYFLLLHLLQPVLLWFFFQNGTPGFRQRLLLIAKTWWPYLLLFIGNLVWRIFFFKFQTHNYEYLFLERLKLGAGPALVHLAETMLTDWWNTSVMAWVDVFRLPFHLNGSRTDLFFIGISAGAAGFFFLSILWLGSRSKDETGDRKDAWQIMTLGCLALILAGGPFWLTEIKVDLNGFASRFTLPFIFGAVLIFSGLVHSLRLPRWAGTAFLALILGLSIGSQFLTNNDFRREWVVQKELFWQLAWRIPALEPDTIVFMSEMPGSHHITYATLSAMFDWSFQPEPAPQRMDYAVYYPGELMKRQDISLNPDQVIKVDHLGAEFIGNTSRSITIQFSRDTTLINGCAHVMSPVLDGNNPFLTQEERNVVLFSDPGLIQSMPGDDSILLIPEIFGKEPVHDRCYFFEKADLAYQQREWQPAIDLFNQAFALGYSQWLDTELVPLIGSYAHIGNWEQAFALSITMSEQAYYPLSSTICQLWILLEEDTPDSIQRRQTLQAITRQFGC
jgi:hypothetical protein